MGSVHRRFREFLRWASERAGGIDAASGIVLFVSRLLAREEIIFSSALTYVNSLVSAEKRLGNRMLSEAQVIIDVRRALRRLGAQKPNRQAAPATTNQIRQALVLSREPRIWAAVLIAWRSGSRVGDVVRLRGADVRLVEGGLRIGWWLTKSDPFHVGAISSVALSEAEVRKISPILHTRKEPLFPEVTTAQVSGLLKKVDPALTCHSLRRGALTALLRSGATLDQIQTFSNHSTLTALLRYLPIGEIEKVRSQMELSWRLSW